MIASILAIRKVKPPTRATIFPARVSLITGASLMSRYTPALTIVALCKSADVGVGATIAPRSHFENGSSADFVIAANASRMTGISTAALSWLTSTCRFDVSSTIDAYMIAPANPRPPRRFIHKARNELFVASSVFV